MCLCLSNCVLSSNLKNEAASIGVGLLRQGAETLIFYSLHIVIVPKPKVTFSRAPCCHFRFHTGCIITVCNLLLAVLDGRRNPRPVGGGEGTNYRDTAVRKGAGGRIRCMCCGFLPPRSCWGNRKIVSPGPYPL